MKVHPLMLSLPLALASAPGLAQTADEVEAGRKLYMSNGCYSCHGTVGQGGERGGSPRIAPDPYPFEAFKLMVRQPREAMPRLDPKFVSDEQLLSIHRYLASIAKGPAAKDIPQLQAVSR
jgi:mono/diheme cytochrome c family protein